jgi:LPXTG-site transpeptidase (sortase) family protein
VSAVGSPQRLLALVGLSCLFAGGVSIGLLVSTADLQAPDGVAVIEEPPLQLPELEAAVEEPVAAATVMEARLLIPRLDVDAPIVTLGVRSGGVMESPAAPDVVGWYSFSAKPGDVGNAVFAGHLDYAGRGRAVFRSLSNALTGDEIVVMQDGLEHRYRVTEVERYEAATAPVDAIVGSSDGAFLTLITCTGDFDTPTGRYDQRLVVKAARVGGSEQGRVK